MRFSICVIFLVISLTLLEAVPAPQLTTIKRQPWKPKAIREKEAAKVAEEAARVLEEASRAAEQATKVSEQTTEIAEHTTSDVEETTVTIEQVTAVPGETTTLVTETTTLPVAGKIPVEDVTESQALLTTVNEVQLETSTLPVPIAMQDNLVANLTPIKRRIVTSRKSTKFMSSAKGRTSALKKKDGQSADEAATCRLSLRGVPCHCRFEGTCRCNCGRGSNNQTAGANRSLSLTN
ncbi:hypothetical protein OUZ56_023069 [Daphnia magna]|uniref:Uncharacterized protein n=1 Tax=Daphnia magna TaxID=35525 RepID=A0ABR0AYD7_9CRUS|nr:hypothetical protein OUZ56_023069 [Daphnia magna]